MLARDVISTRLSCKTRVHNCGVWFSAIHRLVDIFAVGDRVMVLKRGENVGERYVKNIDEHEVLEIIVSGTRESRLTADEALKRAA